MSADRRNDLIALAILTSLITVLFADILAGFNSLYVRDVTHYYYPFKHVLREIVLGGEFPYWNPWFGAGQPMAANPEHEVFYPLTWLILLPSFRTAFNFLIILHLYIGAFTMYSLLRSMKTSVPASTFGAISFSLGGICLSYLNLIPCLFAVAWLPLVCLYTRRFLRERRKRDFALAALTFSITLLIGEPSTILQIGFLLGLYAIYQGWEQRRVLAAIGFVGLISLAALLAGAVQMLPAIDHAGDSVRARGFDFETVTNWSMPPVRVVELVYPNIFGRLDYEGQRVYWGRSLYKSVYGTRPAPFLFSIFPGLLITILALSGLVARVRGWPLVVLTVAASLILAFGHHTPLWRLLYDSGLARSIRYPEKFALMAQFAIVVFGARTLDELLGGNALVRRAALMTTAPAILFAGAAGIFAFAPFAAQQYPVVIEAARIGWLVAVARGALLFILLRNVAMVRRSLWIGVAGTFLVIDLLLQVPGLAPRMPSAFFDPPALASRLPAGRRDWRLFHHAAAWHKNQPHVQPYFMPHPDVYWVQRNGMFPHIFAQVGIRTVLDNDYDRTSLLPTEDFRTSVDELRDLRSDWVEVTAAMSNVWYRLVFIEPEQAFAQAGGDRRLVQPVGIIPLAHSPRYYFAEGVETIRNREDFVRKLAGRSDRKRIAFVEGHPSFTPAAGTVRRVHETTNTAHLEVETLGRAFLVMSVTPHKYWRITVDGQEAPAVVTNVGYQGIVIPTAGRHDVEMRYHNPLITAGAAISLAALLALLLLTRRRGQ